MMQIEIAAAQPYTVSIGHGLLEQVGASIARLIPKGHAALISDDIVYPLYGECVTASLYGAGFVVSRYVLPHGEEHKKLVTVEGILDFLCASGISRGDFLVALGGGVMGDMAGLAAALYLRGIAYFQVPTTLLAAVDAAVGGKTAVNLGWGKNLAGAFHQPGGVFCDCDTFATLPAAIFADGVAEVIKYGMIADRELFEMAAAGKIASNIDAVVARSVSIKSDFINGDEYDRGKRQILNFGHTFAHGLEQVSDYRISHGRAVGVGMVMIAQAAYRLGLVPLDWSAAITCALKTYALPIKFPVDERQLLQVMYGDKKRRGDVITVVLPEQIGRCRLCNLPLERLPALVAAAVGGKKKYGN